MKDRVPKYPGRVTLTPIPGQTNTYDMARADEPIVAGDALNKANLLPDDVVQSLGLAQENPQLKDALMVLCAALTARGSVLPVGSIVIWSGEANAIPDGWQLCDGTNNTPDLRDRFVVGAGDGYAVGATGGEKEVKLTVQQMPSHTHDINLGGSGSTVGTYFPTANTTYPPRNSMTSEAAGGSAAHENRPPFYALCYIMKTA